MLELSFDDLLSRLHQLDEDAYLLYDSDVRFHIIIVGGSALILQKYRTNATHDIDSISVSKELLPLLDKYDINTRAEAYINSFPYNHEDRLKLILSGKKVDVYTISLEDVVIAKLYAARSVDMFDITTEEVLNSIDWKQLKYLATDENEAWASRLNDTNYYVFLDTFKEYERKYNPCAS